MINNTYIELNLIENPLLQEEQPMNEVIVEDEDLSQFEDTLDSNIDYSSNIDNSSKQKEIDTFLVAKKTLNFMRAHGLTVTEFSEKVSLLKSNEKSQKSF